MAERQITTRLVAEGEAQYKSAVRSVNASLRELDSELKVAATAFDRQAGSMDAAMQKQAALANSVAGLREKIELEAEAARKSGEIREKAAAAMEKYRAEMDKLRNGSTEEYKQTEEYAKKMADLQAKLTAAGNAADAAAAAEARHSTAANNAQAEVNKLSGEIDKLNETMEKQAERSRAFGEGMESLASALANVSGSLHVDEIRTALLDCVEAAAQFELGMAGVKRTVGGDDTFIAGLADQFKDLSTTIPVTTREITKIAETAGQLGIQREQVMAFTSVISQLSTTTDLTADSAATMVAQFANITGDKQWSNLGSTIAALGDSTATTASKIVEMSQGIAATASLAGMSSTDILGMSAALGSLGIEASAGSTSISTLISKLMLAVETGDGLEDFAKTAGMSAKEFAAAWGENASGALVSFISGLDDVERNGKSAIAMLKELGITNTRQQKAILGLVNAGDLLSNSLKAAGNAYAENTALVEKASVMYDTTAAKQQLLENSVTNLKVAIGDQLKPAFDELLEAGANVAQWATDFIERNGWVVDAIAALVASITAMMGTVGLVVGALKAWQAAQLLVNAAMTANPIGAVVAALAGLAAGITTVVTLIRKHADAQRDVNESLEASRKVMEEADSEFQSIRDNADDVAQSVETLCSRLDELAPGGRAAADDMSELDAVVKSLNQLVPGLNLSINEQTGALSLSTAEIRNNTQAWLENQIAKAAGARTQKYVDAYTDAYYDQIEAATQYAKAAEKSAQLDRQLGDAEKYLSETTGVSAEHLRQLTRRQLEANAARFEALADQGVNEGSNRAVAAGLRAYTDLKEAAEEAAAASAEAAQAYAYANENLVETKSAMDGAIAVEKQVIDSISAGTRATLQVSEAAEAAAEAVEELAAAEEAEAGSSQKSSVSAKKRTTALIEESKAAMEAAAANSELQLSRGKLLGGGMTGSGNDAMTNGIVRGMADGIYRYKAAMDSLDKTEKKWQGTQLQHNKLADKIAASWAKGTLEQRAHVEARKRAYDELGVAMEELLIREQQAKEQSIKTLESAVQGMNKVKMPGKTSGKDTLKGLESQQKFYQSYADNLNTLRESGALSSDVMAQLADGSEDSMKRVNGLVQEFNKNEDKFKKTAEGINAAYAGVNEAREAAAQEMALLQTKYDETAGQLQEKAAAIDQALVTMATEADVSDMAYKAAEASANAIQEALDAELPGIINSVQKINDALGKLGQTGGGGIPQLPSMPGFAEGLNFVPMDDMVARLHYGEMVLTRAQAMAYRRNESGGIDYKKLGRVMASVLQKGRSNLSQTINFNQAVQSPDEYARQVWRLTTAGLQG